MGGILRQEFRIIPPTNEIGRGWGGEYTGVIRPAGGQSIGGSLFVSQTPATCFQVI